MQRLLTPLEWAARHGGALLAAGIFAGVLVPPLAAVARPTVTASVTLLMTLVMLRVDFRRVGTTLRRPGLVIAMLGWLLAGSPLLTWAVARGVGLDPAWVAGLVLVSTGCAAVSSPAFARLVGLDAELALVVSVLSTLLLPLTAPPLALGLLGIDLAITPTALMGRLGLVVALPLLASLVLRRLAGPVRLAALAGAVDGAVVLLVVLYGFGVMDGMAARVLADPGWIATGLALAYLGNFGSNLATALVFAPAGRRIGLTAGLLSGNRNMALYFAVLPAATDPGVLLFLALGQFPLFTSPALLRPVYRWLAARQAPMA